MKRIKYWLANRFLAIEKFKKIEKQLWDKYEEKERVATLEYNSTYAEAIKKLDAERQILKKATRYCDNKRKLLRLMVSDLYEFQLKTIKTINNINEAAAKRYNGAHREAQFPFNKYQIDIREARGEYERNRRRIARKIFGLEV